MLTKLMAGVVLAGALWVAGDSLYREFGCCTSGCGSQQARVESDCCSDTEGGSCCQSTPSCCSSVSRNLISTKSSGAACCDATWTYCTLTDEIYSGCCCLVIDGRHFCVITDTFVDECCCIPLAD